jgi:hypothetical protein
MRVYIDLPPASVEKVHTLALREDRFPKQQIEHLVKQAIAKEFYALSMPRDEYEGEHAARQAVDAAAPGGGETG